MEQEIDPTVQRRRLRIGLRRARVGQQLTQKEVAEDLGWSLSKVIRIETGQVGLTRTDLKALLQLYKITEGAQVKAFSEMAQQSRKQQWTAYRDLLNADFQIYLGFEASASAIRQAEPLILPGLLQTSNYARAVISGLAGPERTEKTIERQIELRLERQKILGRANPPQMSFVLDEAVIRRLVGGAQEGAKVMREQLGRLVELAERPNVSIRVVRFEEGIHVGLKGPFVILEFPDLEDDDLLFLENNQQSVVTRDKEQEISRYREDFLRLESRAMSPDQTTQMIREVMAGL